MTTPERWKEIDRIFAAALELEPAARAPFLSQTCGSDEELRREVESLLAHDQPESLISGPAIEEATRLLVNTGSRDASPDHIGPYQVTKSLGAGGMGRVYLAHDLRLNRPVAVKLLSGYGVAKEERIQRFRREALAASSLNHPNILTIYEIGEADGQNFIATEFVDGQTLLDLIKSGPVPVFTSTGIAIQLASALAAAHAAGIVHRDIKPANLMVRADGLLKVLDFGIAKYTQTEDSSRANEAQLETAVGTVIGTAAYMSPEQARANPTDHRTDIWSLGVVLYELVTGHRPFGGKTAMDVMSAVLERQPLPFSAHSLAVSEYLERIVFKALQKDSGERYQTANELLADLKELSKQLEFAAGNGGNSAESKPVPGAFNKETNRADEDQASSSSQASTRPQTDRNETKTLAGQTRTDKSKTNRYLLAGALLMLLLVVVGFAYWSYSHPSIGSIAVMPFVNESGNPDLEYLSDGMTDSLINSLSQLPHLSVKARSSVFRYKGKEVDPQRIASELSVQAILNGRVVQRGEDLTLYLSLVDARTNNQLWGEQYDRKLTDIVTLQKEIALDVSSKLRLKLSSPDEQKLMKDYTANTEAYKLYLKGRFHVFKLTPPEVQQGIAYLQQAIQLDPNYTLAYVGLSEAYRSLAIAGDLQPNEFLPKAKLAAQKAIDIDETLGEAHTALGYAIFWGDWNWSAAENQSKRALELNPKSAEAYLFSANFLSNLGRHAEALAEIKRGRELDPLDPRINALEGLFLIHAGRTDEALARLQRTFELDPDFWLAHSFAASAYIEKGMFAEAVAEARRARELFDGSSQPSAFEGYALAKSGKQAEARAVLEQLLKLSTERYVSPYHIALVYNGLNERDKTLAWLERAYEQRNPRVVFLKVEPKWNNLRNDPRFQDLMKRVGF